ncbi:hypothetical protein ColLi_12559 [Colletotrichum liriopes]|uniref:Uncharacterized protein n=1 Tax=Colletotrichum liriopes TaxID=708192 RepID=A0AA37H0H7_9PEZI|nr:hypothetical protein ColLi_12559 [Colletotrichum liriopes]
MGSASYIDPFAFQLPVPALQPSQHMQSRQKPVDPTDTTKLTIHSSHKATGPSGNETRMCLENEAHEDWTYMTSTGDTRALPKLASCGSWGVSLPSKMNATVHIDPYIDRLNGLLHVEIESTKSPPQSTSTSRNLSSPSRRSTRTCLKSTQLCGGRHGRFWLLGSTTWFYAAPRQPSLLSTW